MRSTSGARAAAALFLLLAVGVAHAQITRPCQGITNIQGCSECKRNAGGTRCFYCAYNRAVKWNADGLTVSQCPATTTNCPSDKNCQLCEGATGLCTYCKAGYVFDWRLKIGTKPNDKYGKCIGDGSTSLANIKLVTRNPGCAAGNPDKRTCDYCAGWEPNVNGKANPNRKLLVPLNAIYTNAPFGESLCLTPLEIADYAKKVAQNVPPPRPANCIALGTAMRCMRCVPGQVFAVKNGIEQCVSFADPVVGCTKAAPWRQYCSKCDASGAKCTACVGGRSLDAQGYCSLDCKGLFGIGCQTCDANKCLTADPLYPNGRR